ncbi:hypothetical protein CAL28_19995 [Bordetella genomosp. 11]|uniref:Uncharacterized protein n=1 Tax=Bordetella genomosp. 11 TaxID=1416808 RepID=A0A261UJ46_9BORD|nr:hypothetical protein CAL28_19995 [Bordetella genomosp. 11]
MGTSMRDKMPQTAAVIDSLRQAFGKDSIDRQIRRGLNGEPVFYAREGEHELGTPMDDSNARPGKNG